MSIKKRITLSTSVFLSLIFLIIVFFTIPAISDIKKLRNDIISKKIELEETLVKEKNMSKLNEKIKIIEPKLAEFNNVYINENKELEFITTLEGIAMSSGVKQNINLLTDAAIDEAVHKKIPLKLSVTGDFINIMNYLTALESLNYYVNIETIEISAANKISDGSLLKISTEEINLKKPEIQLNVSAYSYWK